MPALEIMLNSPLISDLIFKGEVGEIKEIMKQVARAGHEDSSTSRCSISTRRA